MSTGANLPLGALAVSSTELLTFPEGLPGFEQNKTFNLLEHSSRGPLKWLQSQEDPEVAFVVVDPREFLAGYRLDLTRADLENLGLSSPRQAGVLAVVHIPENPGEMTYNLLAPLVINPRTRQGRQVPVRTAGYSSRQSLVVRMGEDADRSRTA
jgi:flagellar assembly factor FliW